VKFYSKHFRIVDEIQLKLQKHREIDILETAISTFYDLIIAYLCFYVFCLSESLYKRHWFSIFKFLNQNKALGKLQE